jgi:rhodanese-related sulfurtransferase
MALDMAQALEFFNHHIGLFGAFGVVFMLFIANEIHGQISGARRIAPLEAVRLINDRNALIVDVRAHADFKKGHLMGALNLPLAKLEEHVSELGKDKARPIVVYCALGGPSAEAARKISKHGYAEVYPIRGGLDNWMASSLPVTAK